MGARETNDGRTNDGGGGAAGQRQGGAEQNKRVEQKEVFAILRV